MSGEAVAAAVDPGATPADVPQSSTEPEIQDVDAGGESDDSSEPTGNVNGKPVKVKAPAQSGLPEFFDAKNLGDHGKLVFKNITVNGEDVDMTAAELVKNARLGKAAYRKFDEAKEMREAAEKQTATLRNFVQGLANDPLGAVERLGAKTVERLYEQLYERFQRDALPEADKKALDIEDRMRALEERERQLKDFEAKQAEQDRERAIAASAAEAKQRILGEMAQCMDAASFPKSERLRANAVERMAGYLKTARRSGAPMTVADAFELVQQDLNEIASGIAGTKDAEGLASLVGDKGVSAIRKRELEKIRNPQPTETAQPQARATSKPTRKQPQPFVPPKPLDRMSSAEWRAYLNAGMKSG